MDFIKAQFDRIRQQLTGLTASQRMLIGALVVIMIMTLVFLGKYAGAPEMTPLLEQSLSSDELGRINSYLEGKGITTQISGDRLMVPKDRQYAILADLGYSQMLPRDTKTGFDFISKNMSTWDSESRSEKLWNEAKQMTLAQIIRGFPDVAEAQVIIDQTNIRAMGRSVKPTASINITTRSGKGTKQLAYAAADLVSGSVASMARDSINVIINGLPFPIRDTDGIGGISNEVFDLRQSSEKYYMDKVTDMVGWMGSVVVSVTCTVENTRTTQHEVAYDPKAKFSMPKSTIERTDESHTSGGGTGEAGAAPNLPMGLDNTSSGETTSTTSSESKTEFENAMSKVETQRIIPAGMATPIAASVRVPRSYFARVWKDRNATAGREPTDADIDQVFQVQLASLRSDVKNCTGIKDDDAISVALFTDIMPMLDNVPAVASGSMNLMLGGHVKEIALGVLAVVSLFMVSMMVRKATPALPVAPVPIAPEPPAQLSGAEAIAGEVGEASPLLDGMEVDEESVKTQQMITQVATLVKQNPDAAASLVKRWLNRA